MADSGHFSPKPTTSIGAATTSFRLSKTIDKAEYAKPTVPTTQTTTLSHNYMSPIKGSYSAEIFAIIFFTHFHYTANLTQPGEEAWHQQ